MACLSSIRVGVRQGSLWLEFCQVGSMYAGVVSRESVQIAFTYAALNDLDVCMTDIRNAYIQSPTSQEHYIICGPELGMENVGKVANHA